MTDNETTLLDMIRKSDNPEQALLIAIEVIIDFLNHHETISHSLPMLEESTIDR